MSYIFLELHQNVKSCISIKRGEGDTDRVAVLWHQRGGTQYNIVQMWWNLVPKAEGCTGTKLI